MTGNFLNVIKKKIGTYFSPTRIDHNLISPFAIEIIETLINNKFDAFIVGGAIRDILIGQWKGVLVPRFDRVGDIQELLSQALPKKEQPLSC